MARLLWSFKGSLSVTTGKSCQILLRQQTPSYTPRELSQALSNSTCSGRAQRTESQRAAHTCTSSIRSRSRVSREDRWARSRSGSKCWGRQERGSGTRSSRSSRREARAQACSRAQRSMSSSRAERSRGHSRHSGRREGRASIWRSQCSKAYGGVV